MTVIIVLVRNSIAVCILLYQHVFILLQFMYENESNSDSKIHVSIHTSVDINMSVNTTISANRALGQR